MPLITIRYSTPTGGDHGAAVAALATRLAVRTLKKKANLTAVITEAVPAGRWFIAGRRLDAIGLASYALEIKVTDGTNTVEEKAAFLRELHAGLGEVLGPLHPESYIHVEEARGDAYGYGGLTQAFRADMAAMERLERDTLAEAAIRRYGVR